MEERLEDIYHQTFTDEQIEEEYYNYLTHHEVKQQKMETENKLGYVDLPLKIIVDFNKSTSLIAKFTTNENKDRCIIYDQYTSIDTNTNKISIQYKSKGGYILKNHIIIKAIKYYEKKRLQK